MRHSREKSHSDGQGHATCQTHQRRPPVSSDAEVRPESHLAIPSSNDLHPMFAPQFVSQDFFLKINHTKLSLFLSLYIFIFSSSYKLILFTSSSKFPDFTFGD